ncbi:hypothetical protein L483_12030 [Pseudomonas putida H8234]|nr:hypothetical protein L483_12030 [Pseudomonas putida H8234]
MTALEPVLNNPPTLSPPGELRRGAVAALPVLLGFIPFALVLGAQASQHDLNAGAVALMTGLNFGGGSEFAAIELWTSPPAVLVIVAMTLLVNSRHLLMGATLAPYLRHLPLKKVLGALFFMCDESWAMGLADARQRGGSSLRYHTMTPEKPPAFRPKLSDAFIHSLTISGKYADGDVPGLYL